MYVYELTLSVYYIKYFWSTITGSWILHTTDSKVMHKINVLNVEMLYTWLGCLQGYALSGSLTWSLLTIIIFIRNVLVSFAYTHKCLTLIMYKNWSPPKSQYCVMIMWSVLSQYCHWRLLLACLVFQFSWVLINCCHTTGLLRSHILSNTTWEQLNSKHLALVKDIIFGSSFGFPWPATLCVNCVSSSKSLTENFVAKFIWEQLFITICISSTSGMRFEWKISISETGSLSSVVEVGAWGGVKVITALSGVEDTGNVCRSNWWHRIQDC